MEHLADAGFRGFKLSVVVTRENVGQLDEFKAIADRYGAQLRLTRLRPSGRGADVWDELHPTAAQQRAVYDWLLAHGEEVLTGDSFFHLAALRRVAARPEPVRRGARRVPDRPGRRRVRVPVRDPRRVPGRQRARATAASRRVWRESELFLDLRRPQTGGACSRAAHYDSCRGGCMAAKFFTGLPLDGPDPECVLGHGETLHWRAVCMSCRRSRRSTIPSKPPPKRACDEEPAGRLLAEASRRLLGLAASTKEWFESVAEAQRRAQEASAEVGLLRVVRGDGARRHARRQRQRLQRAGRLLDEQWPALRTGSRRSPRHSAARSGGCRAMSTRRWSRAPSGA